MNTGKLHYLILALFCLVILSGCASTAATSENVPETSPAAEESPGELRISEFILGVGDTIEISVYRHDDLNKTVQIDSSGVITYPLVGDVRAAGVGVMQLKDTIREGLSRYILDPQVSINITGVQSKKYSILGEVGKPGIFSMTTSVNLLEAVAEAGGFTADAKQESVLLIREGLENPQLITFNVEETLEKGDMSRIAQLQSGDILYVPATYIADVSRYFEHLSKIITPILQMETGYFIGQRIEAGSAGRTGTSVNTQ